MEVKFVCPRTNEMQTEDICIKQYEYDACMGCTSQQDTARKALFDMLKKSYADQAEITMQDDGVLIVVRDGLRILADPGDFRDTYVGIDCGKYGETHTHPTDVFEWIEDFRAGRIFILLCEDKMCSAMMYTAQGSGWDDWHEWKWAVDASGTYPAEEYAKAGGFIRR